MKEIKPALYGKLDLQAIVKRTIRTWNEEQQAMMTEGGEGAKGLSACEKLVQKRKECQGKKKKEQAESSTPLDVDGAHQPVNVQVWEDGPGPLDRPRAEFDRRMCNLQNWGPKHLQELAAFCEPALFAGAICPTDSKIVLKPVSYTHLRAHET